MTTLEKQNAYFEKNLEKIITRLNTKIIKMLNFDLDGNSIITDTGNINKAIMLKGQIEKALNELGYSSLVEKSLNDNSQIVTDRIKELSKKLGESFSGVGKRTITSLNKAYYDKMANVQDLFLPGIQEKIMNNVLLGQQYSSLIADMGKATNKLKNEAMTQLRTIKQNFIQTTEDTLAEEIGFGEEKDDIWEYQGAPLQDNSHKECIWALTEKAGTPYFTNQEKEDFEQGVGDFPHPIPRYNCQHYFSITDLTYKEAFGGGAEVPVIEKDFGDEVDIFDQEYIQNKVNDNFIEDINHAYKADVINETQFNYLKKMKGDSKQINEWSPTVKQYIADAKAKAIKPKDGFGREFTKGNLQSSLPKELLTKEYDALKHYTTEGYSEMNRLLRGEITRSGNKLIEIEQYIKNANSGLDKFKNYVGDVSRNINFDINDPKWLSLKKKLKTGNILQEKGFFSTSLKQGNNFGSTGEVVVKYRVKSKTGKYVKDLAKHRTEEEVLFKSGTNFIVKQIKKSGYNDSLWEIEIWEL